MRATRIAIIGLGLIGGSLGLALKHSLGDNVYVTGMDRCSQSMKAALDKRAIDKYVSQAHEIGEQDIVFICTPVLHMVPVAINILPYLQPGTILTDVGSTKEYVLQSLEGNLPDTIRYIGGHPMAGREKSGISAADKDLFIGKWYILTQGINAGPEDYQTLNRLIQAIGAKSVRMEGREHDRCAAYMSHMPHVAAAALVNSLDGAGCQDSLLKLMGGGFRDTTRIASSDADMWADICLTNAEAIAQSLREFQQIIEQVVYSIENKDRTHLYDFFSQSKKIRDDMLAKELR